MAMKGLSLDGAVKLKAALDAYYNACNEGQRMFQSASFCAYGKDTKVTKLMDSIVSYVWTQQEAGRSTIKSYQNQLNQIIAKYKNFDNSGASTLGKVIPTQKKS